MTSASERIADDMFLHAVGQIDDVMLRSIGLLEGAVDPSEIILFQSKVAVNMAISFMASVVASSACDTHADKVIDIWIAALPRMLVEARERATRIGKTMRASAGHA